MELEVVLIGAGAVAKHYANLFAKESIFKVVAVVDVDIAKAEEHARLWGSVGYYDSLTNALKEATPRVAIVTTPSGYHYECVKEALTSGLNVIVEKPVSLRLEHTAELIRLARDSNLSLIPVYQNRANPAVKWALENLSEIGRISMCSVRLRWSRLQEYYDSSWHGTWSLDGGVSSQQGIHHLDLFLEVGGEVRRVCALESNQINDLEAEDTMLGVVEFMTGAVGTVELTTSLRPADAEAVVSFSGENGYGEVGGMALNEITNWTLVDDRERDNNYLRQYFQKVENGMGLGHREYISDCFSFLNGDLPLPPLTPERALQTEKFVHALYASNEQGGWVDLSENRESKRLGKQIDA